MSSSMIKPTLALDNVVPAVDEPKEEPEGSTGLPQPSDLPPPKPKLYMTPGAGRRSSLKDLLDQPATLPKLPMEAVEVLRDHDQKAGSKVIPWASLKLEQVLAKGKSGSVSKGKFNFVEVAVKQVVQSRSSRGDMLKLLEEVNTMKSVNHPNLIAIIGVASDFDVHLGVVMDFMPATLFSLLHDRPYVATYHDFLSWKTCFLAIIQDIAFGMCHLHQRVNLLHRDLKPENVMITKGWVAKVGEFGEVTQFTEEPDEEDPSEILISGAPLYNDDEEDEADAGGHCSCFGAKKLVKRKAEHDPIGARPPTPPPTPPTNAAPRPKLPRRPSMKTSFLMSSEQKARRSTTNLWQAAVADNGDSGTATRRNRGDLEGFDEEHDETHQRHRKSVVERRVVGTLAYLAPETARSCVDPYADEPGLPADVRTRPPSHSIKHSTDATRLCMCSDRFGHLAACSPM